MFDLTEARSAVSEPPFTHKRIDYFRPITVKRGKRARASTETGKRYGAIFTCLTYRVIHLELINDLSTDCFIMALQRFTSRRGNPRSMWSDNDQQSEKIKKTFQKMFKRKGLDIIIKCNTKIVNYLDVTLNLNDGSYRLTKSLMKKQIIKSLLSKEISKKLCHTMNSTSQTADTKKS